MDVPLQKNCIVRRTHPHAIFCARKRTRARTCTRTPMHTCTFFHRNFQTKIIFIFLLLKINIFYKIHEMCGCADVHCKHAPARTFLKISPHLHLHTSTHTELCEHANSFLMFYGRINGDLVKTLVSKNKIKCSFRKCFNLLSQMTGVIYM